MSIYLIIETTDDIDPLGYTNTLEEAELLVKRYLKEDVEYRKIQLELQKNMDWIPKFEYEPTLTMTEWESYYGNMDFDALGAYNKHIEANNDILYEEYEQKVEFQFRAFMDKRGYEVNDHLHNMCGGDINPRYYRIVETIELK